MRLKTRWSMTSKPTPVTPGALQHCSSIVYCLHLWRLPQCFLKLNPKVILLLTESDRESHCCHKWRATHPYDLIWTQVRVTCSWPTANLHRFICHVRVHSRPVWLAENGNRRNACDYSQPPLLSCICRHARAESLFWGRWLDGYSHIMASWLAGVWRLERKTYRPYNESYGWLEHYDFVSLWSIAWYRGFQASKNGKKFSFSKFAHCVFTRSLLPLGSP